MNTGFALHELRVSGRGVQDAVLTFADGLNVIAGPSDTGKTYVAQCLSFLLGSGTPPKGIPEAAGYETAQVRIEARRDGYEHTLTRRLDGAGNVEHGVGDRRAHQLRPRHDPKREDTLPAFLLEFSGLSGVVRTTAAGQTRPLAFSDVARLFFVDEQTVIGEGSPVLSGQYTSRLVERRVFRFLLTGADDAGVVALEKPERARGHRAGRAEVLEELEQSVNKELHRLEVTGSVEETERRVEQWSTRAELVALLTGFDRKLAVGGEVGRITIKEVVVRPPEVFVRSLAHQEAVALKRRAKAAEHFSTRQRAAILLASNVGNSVPQIATMWMTDESHVRRVIHEFNERGLASLDPDYRGGRARRITDSQRREIVAVAGARPDTQGVALTRWSLPRLADHLAQSGIAQISAAHLGRMLGASGLSFQRTRTWKASPDPDFEAKAARVLELCAAPPSDGGAVIAFDQMGPISLRPMAGAGWAPKGLPERQRATFHRRHGIRYVMGAYDVHDDRLRTRLRPRRRGRDNLAFMRQLRTVIPARRRIYWIQDNLSANWTQDIRAYAVAHNIELVATPTYASYLNPVECHFFPISEFVVRNADYVDWDAFNWALARHVTHRNGPHRDKRIRILEARHQIAA